MEKKQFSYNRLIGRTTALSFDETGVYVGEGADQEAVLFADVVSLSRTRNAMANR